MLVSMKTILEDANQHNYAVIAANCINFEFARAIVSAAEEMNAPIIVNVSERQMALHADGALMAMLIEKLAARVKVPIALNLDHGKSYQAVTYAFRKGFTGLMIDASEKSLEENIKATQAVVALASGHGIAVEAELGHVGQAKDNDQNNSDLYTNPDEARYFVEQTKVDALAVAVGTAHGCYPKDRAPKIDFERIAAIKKALGMPLVLHGGSNTGEANIKEAVQHGINKINVCTDTFNACKTCLKDMFMNDPDADYLQMMRASESAAKELIRYYIAISGSENQAANFDLCAQVKFSNQGAPGAVHSEGGYE